MPFHPLFRHVASGMILTACLAGTADGGRLPAAQQPAAQESAAQESATRVPIVIHLDGDTDSCQSTGQVVHLEQISCYCEAEISFGACFLGKNMP